MNEKAAGKPDHGHSRRERHPRPWHAKPYERTVDDPDILRNRLQNTNRWVGAWGLTRQGASLVGHQRSALMLHRDSSACRRSYVAKLSERRRLKFSNRPYPSAGSVVLFLETAVTRIPKIIIVENVEREIIFTEFQITENKQVASVTQVSQKRGPVVVLE